MRTTRDNVNNYLSRLKKGEDCLEEFIDYSCGYLKYIAYKYLIDKSLVDDVIFLSYDKILQALQTFDYTKNGLAWIVTITQNEAYKLNRDETCRDISLEEYKNIIDYNSHEETACVNTYDIERAMSYLNEQERTIIEFSVYMGMTVREIATQMDIPKSTVAYTLKQSLKKLEKYLT
ncbi:MAG: sigma-70 family RNA polymerase sigma factor [Clostridiales bacterium]|nr:sigma-70 family RNA polymerase sigma factor [Clostridiales bacterium]